MSGPAPLVAEDDPVIGEGLRRAFEAQGHAARWARTAAEALEADGPVPLVIPRAV